MIFSWKMMCFCFTINQLHYMFYCRQSNKEAKFTKMWSWEISISWILHSKVKTEFTREKSKKGRVQMYIYKQHKLSKICVCLISKCKVSRGRNGITLAYNADRSARTDFLQEDIFLSFQEEECLKQLLKHNMYKEGRGCSVSQLV